mgnify:CR=1 FL=1
MRILLTGLILMLVSFLTVGCGNEDDCDAAGDEASLANEVVEDEAEDDCDIDNRDNGHEDENEDDMMRMSIRFRFEFR